jgi:REP element-mobilizing transposase RayT
MSYDPRIRQRRSIRLQGYDYSQEGMYFITLCCYEKNHLFGKIADNQMLLNSAGKIAHNEWFKTPEIRLNTALAEFVVMPNHIHGIIIIKNAEVATQSSIRPLSGTSHTIGAIVRGYKSSVTKKINLLGTSRIKVWQRNYYEHIIRNDESYQNIANYIINNPANWNTDRLL